MSGSAQLPSSRIDDLAALDLDHLAVPDRDLEAAVAVDHRDHALRAVHTDLSSTQEVARAEALVHGVQPAVTPRRVAPPEIVEHGGQEVFAIPSTPCERADRPRPFGKLVRRLRDVHADAEHDRAVLRLCEAPGDLPPPEHDVVRPLDLDREPERALERVRDSHAGDERELWHVAFGRRLQEEREEEGSSGGRLPAPAEPAPSGGLVVGHDDRPFGQRGVDEELRRLAGLDVEPGTAERHGFSHTETCLSLSLVKGLRRRRGVAPAVCSPPPLPELALRLACGRPPPPPLPPPSPPPLPRRFPQK